MIEAISHRGSRARHTENTVGAVLAAIGDGAEGIEIDAHSTRDGIIVVHHDFFPRGAVTDRRLESRPLADLTFDEVQRFDLGDGGRIPSLQEILGAVRDRARLYIEIKGRNSERQLALALGSTTSNIAIHSFNHRSIRRMSELLPQVRRGVLQGSYMVDNCAALKSASARDLWQYWELVDADLVAEVHGCGARVIAWTVNEERDWERLASIGVDAICTDDVARLVRWRDGRAA